MSDKARQITELLAPTVTSMGLELLGAEYLPAPGGATLRLYIDVPVIEGAEAAPETAGEGGSERSVTVDDCEAVSREVSALLDVEDPISGNYTLEVSSPGMDRPLFTAAHFARYLGETAKLGLKLPQDGRRRLQGVIAEVGGETVTVQVDATTFTVAFDNIDKARLVPDWVALGLAPQPKKKRQPKQPAAGRSRAEQAE